MNIKEILVENQTCPLGIDVKSPLLGWEFGKTAKRSIFQDSYQILVSENKNQLIKNIGDTWDSGKIHSRKNANVIYEGVKLKSRQRYYWKVKIWDSYGNETESAISWWEMGLLESTDWQSKWIGGPNNENATPIFRYDFNLNNPVSRSRVYICGLGHYELRLNGKKVSDNVLEPGWTNYDKTCLYATYDVTPYLRTTANTVGIILGNGFYNVVGDRYTKFKDSFGNPKCIVQLEVTYHDGSTEMICSNNQWKTSFGPTTFSCIYGGEDYDANKEQPGWDKPGFETNTSWTACEEVKGPKGILKSQNSIPLKVMKTLQPADIKKLGEEKYVIDFGQNFSGWINISVKGAKNSQVKMIPGELLNRDGTPNQTWSGSPYEYNYKLKGEGVETWRPKFSYYGLQYVQIEGIHLNGDSDSNSTLLLHVEGEMIYPDIVPTGSFRTSNQLINQTHKNINMAILSNMKSVFTDCPHREKLGWLEQVHLMGPSILYNYSVESLLTKVMADIRDAQLPNGMIPTTAPEYVVFEEPWDIFRHSIAWGATYILTPWYMYQKFGNSRIISDHYESMKKYIDYLNDASEDYIITDGLGDWYDVGEQGPGFAQNTPIPLTETAMFYHLVSIFSKVSEVIGNNENKVSYENTAKEIKQVFNRTFFNVNTRKYESDSQAANAIPIALGLVDDPYKEDVLNSLIDDIIENNFHTTSGDVGHRYVLQALAENNRSDIIFKMSQKTDYPSYGYQIGHGATTLTEAWDGPTVGKSQNHFMIGHIEEWFYNGLAGLHASYNLKEDIFNFVIKPFFEEALDFVQAETKFLNGKLKSEWTRLGNDQIKLAVEIPANSSATIYIPAASTKQITESNIPIENLEEINVTKFENGIAVIQLNSGQYSFVSKLE